MLSSSSAYEALLQHARLSLVRRWMPGLLLLVLLPITVLFWHHQRTLTEADHRKEFERDAAAMQMLVEDKLRLHNQFLGSLQAFAVLNVGQSLKAWHSFASYVEVADLDGFNIFAFAPRLAQSEKARAGMPVFPKTDAEYVFPVVFVGPNNPNAQRAMGFDLYSDPDRRQAIDTAIRTGTTTLSAPIELIYDRGTQRLGFLMVRPVYEPGVHLVSDADRLRHARGVVFIAYRADEFFGNLGRSIDFRVADVGSERTTPLFDGGGAKLNPDRERLVRQVQFGSRMWSFEVSDSNLPGRDALDSASLILIGGIAANILLALLVFNLSNQRHLAEELAQQLTASLRESEQRLRASNDLMRSVFNAATEVAIIATDPDGLITIFNRGAEKMLGYDADEMVGKCTPLRFHRDVEVDARAAALSANIGRPVSGFEAFCVVPRRFGSERREWTYCTRNGRQLTVDLVATALHDREGVLTGFLGVAVDITRSKAAETELKQHRDRLQELVEERTQRLEDALRQARTAVVEKTEFLANMSHELRTPMHAILSFAELGNEKARAANHDKLTQYFSRIIDSAERLLTLINDLLDLSKFEAGRIELGSQPADIRRLVSKVLDELGSLLETRQLEVNVLDHATQTVIFCDEKRIERVLHNLMSNAIKFSSPGGRLKIVLADTALPSGRRATDAGRLPALTLEVSDTGVGIPPDELESIFDKFVQSSKTKTGAGGTGLGLAICREIVAAHRGTIVARNNLEGGATFVVTLPVEKGNEAETGTGMNS